MDGKGNAMDLNSDLKELVGLFAKQEVLIGKLYKLFSFRFREHKELWMKIEKFFPFIDKFSEKEPSPAPGR